MKAVNVSDWNTNDAWQRSRINFDGWRYVRFPLPGNYEGEGYHWPGNCNWKRTGDGVVKYPLKFKRLIFELPQSVLHMTQYVEPSKLRNDGRGPEIYVKDLQATYEAPETVGAAL